MKNTVDLPQVIKVDNDDDPLYNAKLVILLWKLVALAKQSPDYRYVIAQIEGVPDDADTPDNALWMIERLERELMRNQG